LTEICERPLKKRMLFEVRRDRKPDKEVDAEELMRLYWELRVVLDIRVGTPIDELGAAASQNLSGPAEGADPGGSP
jgi:hypothetical protein